MAVPDPLKGDIFQVVIGYHSCGQQLLNILHYIVDQVDGDAPHYQDYLDNLESSIASDIVTGIIVPMQALQGANTTYDFIQVQKVYPTREYYVRYAQTSAGTGSQPCTSPNVAFSVTKQGEKTGKGKSGHFQLGGIGSNTYANGVAVAAAIEELDTLGQALLAGQHEVAGLPIFLPGIYTAGKGAGLNWNPLRATTSRQEVRTMHRRTVGLGI